MFVSKINGAQSFHKAVFSGNGQGAGTAAQPDLNKMSDSAKLDLLVKKMNTLQMDVEKMRARQMLADRMIATGVASLMGRNVQNRTQADEYHKMKDNVKILNELA